MNKIYERTGIKEQGNLKISSHKEEVREKNDSKIKYAVTKGQNRKSKYFIDQAKLQRELSRALNDLSEIENFYLDTIDRESRNNIRLLIKGYKSYLKEHGMNFDYIELRKYRNGIVKHLIICIRETFDNELILKHEKETAY